MVSCNGNIALGGGEKRDYRPSVLISLHSFPFAAATDTKASDVGDLLLQMPIP